MSSGKQQSPGGSDERVTAAAVPVAFVESCPLPLGGSETVGPYRVRRLIGMGGMGAVYEAVQDQPKRLVALKVMRKGVASRAALRRFEYEIQTLARLRHPGIAQVYSAGTHHDGQEEVPYFAMELIQGANSLVDFCNVKELTLREKLDLFAQVCDAVHHGHQKGVIHRDLKPGNILVDSAGHPKIIDFGVARSTDSDLAVTTLQTNLGELVGTIEYMSPEQCAADPHDIDIRCDVYSLGVILYELLVGKTPYTISRNAIYEAARIIREEIPAKPSGVNPFVRGDVEKIVLKALEKERDRRYSSAAELGEDIRRFLNQEPISARTSTLGYQLAMMARRNRAAVFATAAVLVTVLTAAVWVVYASIWRDTNRINAAQATREAANAREVMRLSLICREGASEPTDVSDVLGRLDLAEKKLPEMFAGDPSGERGARMLFGRFYRGHGEAAKAVGQFEVVMKLSSGSADALGEELAAAGECASAFEELNQPDKRDTVLRSYESRWHDATIEPAFRSAVRLLHRRIAALLAENHASDAARIIEKEGLPAARRADSKQAVLSNEWLLRHCLAVALARSAEREDRVRAREQFEAAERMAAPSIEAPFGARADPLCALLWAHGTIGMASEAVLAEAGLAQTDQSIPRYLAEDVIRLRASLLGADGKLADAQRRKIERTIAAHKSSTASGQAGTLAEFLRQRPSDPSVEVAAKVSELMESLDRLPLDRWMLREAQNLAIKGVQPEGIDADALLGMLLDPGDPRAVVRWGFVKFGPFRVNPIVALEDAERIHRVHLRNRGDARLALLSALANVRTNRFREADAALLPAVFPSSGDLAEAAAVRALVRAGQGRPELAFAAKEEFLALCSEFWKTADRAARVSGPAASRLDTLSKWRAEVLSVVSERK